MERITENCGVCVTHTIHDCYRMLDAMRNRGQDATGILAVGYNVMNGMKWVGDVTSFSLESLHKIFPGEYYHTFLGHVRYKTRGQEERLLDDAHPHCIGGSQKRYAEHIELLDVDSAIAHNGQIPFEYMEPFVESLDPNGCDSKYLLEVYKKVGEDCMIKKIPGTYSAAIADKGDSNVKLVRDRYGTMPMWIGMKSGKAIAASENFPIKKIGGKAIEELNPGAVAYFGPEGGVEHKKVVEPAMRFCFFNYNYLAHPDSRFNGRPVDTVRWEIGAVCAEEYQPYVDFVTYIPEAPEFMARSYAKKRGLEFVETMYKKMKLRAFQMSTMEKRNSSIRNNLFLIQQTIPRIKGASVLEVDDSGVRGINGKYGVQLLREAGAKEVHLLLGTPALGPVIDHDGRVIKHGCMHGVDMPPDDYFFIRETGYDPEAISKWYGADSVHMISREGMFRAIGLGKDSLCYECIGGTPIFDSFRPDE